MYIYIYMCIYIIIYGIYLYPPLFSFPLEMGDSWGLCWRDLHLVLGDWCCCPRKGRFAIKCHWLCIPSGELTVCYGKSQFFMGKFTISIAIFHSFLYVHQRVHGLEVKSTWGIEHIFWFWLSNSNKPFSPWWTGSKLMANLSQQKGACVGWGQDSSTCNSHQNSWDLCSSPKLWYPLVNVYIAGKAVENHHFS